MNEDEAPRSRPFLSVLADAHRARRTGIVRVLRGEGRLAVALSEGKVVALESEGMPSSATHDEDQELAALLAEAFAEGEPGLSQAAARQTLLETLRARDAHAAFEEGGAERADPPLGFSTEDLLREAAHTADVFLVEDGLGALDGVLEAAGPIADVPEGALTPSEGFLLSRVDGRLSAREVLDLVPLGPDTARRSLFSLLIAGYARLGPPRVRPTRTVAPAAVETRSPESPPPEAEPPKARSLAEAALQVEGERAGRARRESIEEAFEALARKPDHFEVLGLDRTASEAEVKSAYFRLARRFHPDTMGDHPDLQDKMQAVFARLGDAFAVLGQPKSRADYELTLPGGLPGPLAEMIAARPVPSESTSSRRPPPDASPAAAAQKSAEDAAWQAEEALKRAEALLAEGKFWEAIQILEAHVGNLAGRARYRGKLVLAQAYLHNPKWLHRGEELLRAVVREDPLNAEAYYLLGTIYKAGGLPTRAASMFRKALEARPGHPAAAEELAGLEKAPPPPRRWFSRSSES